MSLFTKEGYIKTADELKAERNSEVAQLHKDAERYRWLKANQVSRMPGGWGYSLSISWGKDAEVDAVIDAARENKA